MRRRAFLGVLGGAAASGPSLAKSIASVELLGAPPVDGPCDSITGLAGSGSDCKASEILNLRSLLSGEAREAKERAGEVRRRNIEMVERFRLDALRSVSPSHKARMLLEYQIMRDGEDRRYLWQRRLDYLLTPD